MPIDFLLAPCTKLDCHCRFPKLPGRICKKTTTNKKFGLYDDPPHLKLPAHIQEYIPEDWIAEVYNPNLKSITFKAIDNCVPVFRPNEEMDSRCDGMLLHDNNLTFVELKDRIKSGWVKDGREQLTTSIRNFSNNHDITQYDQVEAYICNKQRPIAITSNTQEIQKFKDDTAVILNNNGLLLKVKRVIQIE